MNGKSTRSSLAMCDSSSACKLLERLLQRQEGLRQVVAVTTHDLVQHGLQPRQFEAKGFMIAGLDVFDQRRQADVGPRRFRGRWRDCRVQLHEQRVDVEAAGGAGLRERDLAAAAKVDLMLLEDPDGRGGGGCDLGNRRFWCDRHGRGPHGINEPLQTIDWLRPRRCAGAKTRTVQFVRQQGGGAPEGHRCTRACCVVHEYSTD